MASSSGESEIDIEKNVKKNINKSKKLKCRTEISFKKWSHELVHTLIDLYENRPCLWDVFCKKILKRNLRDKIIE